MRVNIAPHHCHWLDQFRGTIYFHTWNLSPLPLLVLHLYSLVISPPLPLLISFKKLHPRSDLEIKRDCYPEITSLVTSSKQCRSIPCQLLAAPKEPSALARVGKIDWMVSLQISNSQITAWTTKLLLTGPAVCANHWQIIAGERRYNFPSSILYPIAEVSGWPPFLPWWPGSASLSYFPFLTVYREISYRTAANIPLTPNRWPDCLVQYGHGFRPDYSRSLLVWWTVYQQCQRRRSRGSPDATQRSGPHPNSISGTTISSTKWTWSWNFLNRFSGWGALDGFAACSKLSFIFRPIHTPGSYRPLSKYLWNRCRISDRYEHRVNAIILMLLFSTASFLSLLPSYFF